jgi:hypothetical protein
MGEPLGFIPYGIPGNGAPSGSNASSTASVPTVGLPEKQISPEEAKRILPMPWDKKSSSINLGRGE